jgi:aryl-alcohol dehydrogenase-like predicted oxidoreductase
VDCEAVNRVVLVTSVSQWRDRVEAPGRYGIGCALVFDALQTTFNLVDQRARYGLFERAVAGGMGLIMKRPMANAVWGRIHERPGPMTGAPGLFVERARAIRP